MGKCLLLDKSFEQLRTAATTLLPYAVALRYPGEMPEFTESEAKQALALVRELWDFVLERMPEEVRIKKESQG